MGNSINRDFFLNKNSMYYDIHKIMKTKKINKHKFEVKDGIILTDTCCAKKKLDLLFETKCGIWYSYHHISNNNQKVFVIVHKEFKNNKEIQCEMELSFSVNTCCGNLIIHSGKHYNDYNNINKLFEKTIIFDDHTHKKMENGYVICPGKGMHDFHTVKKDGKIIMFVMLFT
jgi:hypothetical protein